MASNPINKLTEQEYLAIERAAECRDVSIVCEGRRPLDEDDDITENPIVVFEILSPSTERFDFGTKSQIYRTVDSLTDIVLVSQDKMLVERYTRQPDGAWLPHEYAGPEAELRIDSIGVSIPLRRIYGGVTIRPTV